MIKKIIISIKKINKKVFKYSYLFCLHKKIVLSSQTCFTLALSCITFFVDIKMTPHLLQLLIMYFFNSMLQTYKNFFFALLLPITHTLSRLLPAVEKFNLKKIGFLIFGFLELSDI